MEGGVGAPRDVKKEGRASGWPGGEAGGRWGVRSERRERRWESVSAVIFTFENQHSGTQIKKNRACGAHKDGFPSRTYVQALIFSKIFAPAARKISFLLSPSSNPESFPH